MTEAAANRLAKCIWYTTAAVVLTCGVGATLGGSWLDGLITVAPTVICYFAFWRGVR